MPFQPISDNIFFHCSFFHIFDTFNLRASISICRGLISRLHFVLLPVCVIYLG